MSEAKKEEIVLRSTEPTKAQDIRLHVPPTWSVGQLKEYISQEHPRHPNPSEQVLIYHGKVLSESEAPLEKILRKLETEGHHTMHLVFRGGQTIAQSESVPNLGDVPDGHPDPDVTSTGDAASSRGHLEGAPVNPPEGSPSAITQQTSPMVALPVVMVNPIVNAAYNAALAAVYQPKGDTPVQSASGDPSGSGSGVGHSSEAVQNVQQPMVPAIAFFPLGIPVLVPAAAQNQGFQVGQSTQATQQQPQPPVQPMQRRPPPPPMGNQYHYVMIT